MTVFYVLAMYGFNLSGYGLNKAYQSHGSQPIPGVVELLCNLFGGPLSLVGLVGLFIVGFFHFSWWVPIAVFVACGFAVAFTFHRLPLGATYALFGFPFGLAFVVLWLLT